VARAGSAGRARGRRIVVGVVGPLVAGVGLLALLVWLTGPEATFDTLGRLSAWQGVVLLLAAFATSLFGALALRVILGHYGHRVSVWLLFRLSILAFAVGWLVPSGYVAGFPVAAYLLRRRGVPFARGLAAFLIERFLELGAYAVVLPTALLGGLGTGPALLAGVFAPLAGLAIVALDLTLGWRLGRRGLTALLGVVPRAAAPVLERGIDFLGTVASFFRSPLPVLLAATALSVLAIATSFVRAVLTAQFLHLPLGVPQVALLLAFSLVMLAIPFLPGAIGIYEGGMVGFFRLLGRPSAEGIAFAMAVHGVELVVAAAGFVFLARLGVDLATAQEVSAAATPRTGS
jgi:uncharacterized protein (TIRG00374 family)